MGLDDPLLTFPDDDPAETDRPHVADLMVCQGPHAGTRFVLAGAVVEIGRDPGAGIVLDDITVTGRHAELRRTRDGYRIADLGSLNGTYVNGERVHTADVAPGDEIQIGRFRLVITRSQVA